MKKETPSPEIWNYAPFKTKHEMSVYKKWTKENIQNKLNQTVCIAELPYFNEKIVVCLN